MSKKKILLGLLIAAGTAYVVYKALKPKVECDTTDVNSDVGAVVPEKTDEKKSVDIEEVVAYVTQSVENAGADEACNSEQPVVTTEVPVVAEEVDFVKDETV